MDVEQMCDCKLQKSHLKPVRLQHQHKSHIEMFSVEFFASLVIVTMVLVFGVGLLLGLIWVVEQLAAVCCCPSSNTLRQEDFELREFPVAGGDYNNNRVATPDVVPFVPLATSTPRRCS